MTPQMQRRKNLTIQANQTTLNIMHCKNIAVWRKSGQQFQLFILSKRQVSMLALFFNQIFATFSLHVLLYTCNYCIDQYTDYQESPYKTQICFTHSGLQHVTSMRLIIIILHIYFTITKGATKCQEEKKSIRKLRNLD